MPRASITSASAIGAKRVTMRQVAKAAGVSSMTVSLALRGHARIPEPTRRKIERLAARLGYRPDPAISKFMNNIREGRRASYQANLALIAESGVPAVETYSNLIREGILLRAQRLGYGIQNVEIDTLERHGRRLAGILRSRGVHGILFLPIARPRDVSALMPWEDFSVVTTTYSIIAPHFHRVVPHQYANTRLAVKVLLEAGYRRLGLVLTGHDFDERTNLTHTAVLGRHNQDAGADAVPPLILESDAELREALPRWYRDHRPDVVVTNAAAPVQLTLRRHLGLRIPRQIGLLDLSRDTNGQRYAGIAQAPRIIGETAVDLLVAMLQRGETATPLRPRVTMIEGEFMPGPTLRAVGG